METAEFRAMGSACRIVVDGGRPDSAQRAESMVHRLEHAWSRFDADSEVTSVNNAAGNIHLVSAETYTLFDHAAAATAATDGAFNPLMLRQLRAHGYTARWDEATPDPSRLASDEAAPPTDDTIILLPDVHAVAIPRGTAFDPGGIGKGLCADMVTAFLVDEGVSACSVELGGDLRVHGTPWYGPQWRIGIEHPRAPGEEIAAFTPRDGAVATSSRLRRQWSSGQRNYHHILDPRTGHPAQTDLIAVSCCAPSAWWAEVAAKVILISGSVRSPELFRQLGVHCIAVRDDGVVIDSASTSIRRSATANGVSS